MIGAVLVELLAAPEVAALVGDRVFPVHLPVEPVLPAIAYQVLDEKRQQIARRPSGRVRSLVQLSIVAPDYDAAYAVAWVIRRRLERWRGRAGGVLVYDTLEESSQDVGDGAPHMVAMTWRIHWKEQ
ncbi:DUF3168 domain-containing protein [Chromobacterium vaccinii]|nr:DUF3168 domain-containing protein [Chromobacterium vaccinii]MBX9355867.1 DUF3168 domain-containing protein [Chromobacterium vaccinii]